MGKEGDLWDDSALIKAFDNAISKYKVMHGMGGSSAGEKTVTDTEENLPAAEDDSGNNEFVPNHEHAQNDDNLNPMLETTAEIGETVKLLKINESSSSEFGSSSKHEGCSNVENGNPPPTNEIPAVKSVSPGEHMVSSDVNSQNEATWYSNGPEEYGQLLNKYYELEGQRQQILQKLNGYSNWNYQHPFSSASTSEEYQVPVSQPYDTVTCYCPYGCQSWSVPCNSFPGSCSGCTDKSIKAIPKSSQDGDSIYPEDPDFVKMAMVAAERALSSLTKESNEGKDKQFGTEIDHTAESTKSATDLAVVLNAWYSAGFYTGKYLSEQSLEKREHGQGL